MRTAQAVGVRCGETAGGSDGDRPEERVVVIVPGGLVAGPGGSVAGDVDSETVSGTPLPLLALGGVHRDVRTVGRRSAWRRRTRRGARVILSGAVARESIRYLKTCFEEAGKS